MLVRHRRLESLTGSNLILNNFLNVSRETSEKFQIYIDLLKKWQKHINLVSRGTINDILNRHIIDSLQILKFLDGNKILDVGSGGGFPGMVLALASSKDVTCLDSDKRKIIFLDEVARNTKTQVCCMCERVENLNDSSFDHVTARAVFPLKRLIEILKKNAPEGTGVFLKGKTYQEEIDEAKGFYDFDVAIHKSETDEEAKILVIKNVSWR